jgi:ribose/xylose/arabinose/galactoside ABC-type transport system permease subunit
MTGPAPGVEAPRRAGWKRLLRPDLLVLGMCAAYAAGVGPFTPGFFTIGNAENLVVSALPLFILAAGQTLVMVTGGIDLSMTSVLALASITGARVMTPDGGAGAIAAALVLMLSAGAAVGALNGLAVARLRMPPFIVTLTAMTFISGLAVWLTRSRNIGPLPAGFNAIGGRAAIVAAVAAAAGLGAHLLLSRTLLGRWLTAVGHNPRAALVSGVPVSLVLVLAYVLSGLFAGLASVIYTAQTETGSPILGQRLLLDVVAATVIGGTSLFGGRGRIHLTLLGVVFFKLIDNTLNLLDLSHFTIMMVKGGLILAAALLDTLRHRILETS